MHFERISHIAQESLWQYKNNTLYNYRQMYNISPTPNQNLNDSRLTLHLPLPNHLKPGVKSWIKI